ncbi:hypothetical protein P3S67_008962 [Capsicum chacoense]
MMRVNSVNGFICFWSASDQDRHHVLNPVTKDYVITPPNPYLDQGFGCRGCSGD